MNPHNPLPQQERIEALIHQWREEVKIREKLKDRNRFDNGRISGLEDCADQLAAALHAEGAPQEEGTDAISESLDTRGHYLNGPERELPVPTMADAAEMLWIVLANVSGGNWKLQSQEWQDAATRWRDYYFKAVAAEGAPAPPHEWQPMDTAPKDGTPVWLVEDGPPSGLLVPHQIAGWWRVDKRYAAGGCWEAVDRNLVILPTHWQPLPLPPAPPKEKA